MDGVSSLIYLTVITALMPYSCNGRVPVNLATDSRAADLAEYHRLIATKRVLFTPRGIDKIPTLHSKMFSHQQASTEFALRTGCAGLFLATGLGKSLCSLEWGRVMVRHTNKPVLMLAPLAVSKQHEREAAKFGIDAKSVREPDDIGGQRIYITNYERLAKFDVSQFGAIILDESGILKAYTGSTSRALRAAFAATPYRLAASATPAPNDHMEIGQQSEFLGIMESPEMLSRWFIADQSDMGRYRVKNAARKAFWEWVASWARCIDLPSDLGYDDGGYILPTLNVKRHVVESDTSINTGEDANGQSRLFRIPDTSATSIHAEKRLTVEQRADAVATIVAAEPDEAWLVWCDTDYEADALRSRIADAVEVRGSQSPDEKETKLTAFADGGVRVLITKPKLAGFGLNFQHCARQAFIGVSFSYEQFYQAIRRCWRFGQTRPVDVHVVMAQTERMIWDVITRKADAHDDMKQAMRSAMARAHKRATVLDDYAPTCNVTLPTWMSNR